MESNDSLFLVTAVIQSNYSLNSPAYVSALGYRMVLTIAVVPPKINSPASIIINGELSREPERTQFIRSVPVAERKVGQFYFYVVD